MALDWRIQAVALTASDSPAANPGGPSHPAGSAVAMASIVSLPDGTQSTFLTPSAAALALSIAATSVNKAARVKKDLRFTNTRGPDPAVLYQQVTPPDRVFDYFEHCFVGLVFSIQALEAYCNYKIAYNLKQDFTTKRRGMRVDLTSIETQNQISIDDKLGIVLPKLLNVPSPKGGSIWSNYINIKKLRNAMVHITSPHQWTSSQEAFQNSPYAWCLSQHPSSILSPALEMIRYFAVDHELGWLEGARKSMTPDQNTQR